MEPGRNRPRDTLGGQRSHHCAIPSPQQTNVLRYHMVYFPSLATSYLNVILSDWLYS